MWKRELGVQNLGVVREAEVESLIHTALVYKGPFSGSMVA